LKGATWRAVQLAGNRASEMLAAHLAAGCVLPSRGLKGSRQVPQHDRKSSLMPATREQLFAKLDALGIKTETVEHEAVFTVAESEELHRTIPGGHTKNLFLEDAKGRLYLIIAHAHTKVDLKSLHKLLGCARLSFGRPARLSEVLGVPAGSVTAFALVNDAGHQVRVVIDAALMTFDSINCHPLENTATTNIAREDLLRFIRACGHEPRIMALSGISGAAEEAR
jgi:Ala-tRNA(Pro) deacylase